MKLRRICFHAGPGSGKSTIAARTFAEMKIRGHDCEHISEFVKTMAHEGRFPQSYDQIYIFGEQIHREDVALRHVDFIVTDCPIFMCCAYASFYKSPGAVHLAEIASDFEADFTAMNFYLERTVDYKNEGRYQNLQQAKEFDDFLTNFMSCHIGDNWKRVKVSDFEDICAEIESVLANDINRGYGIQCVESCVE